MELEKQIELLSEVRRVDAAPFLKTRIDARILQMAEDSISSGWVWSFAATVALLIVVNSMIFLGGTDDSTSSESGAYTITQAMGMNVSNQLYND
ncbi:MAG: hypothetical protein KBF73_06720 [Flavobacteriales bacterium]|nr:hypothetical protein [Flavobacteriales bacterium]